VEQEEVLPAVMRPLVDDHVETGRRLEVTLVELLPRARPPEHSGEAPHAVAVPIDVERPAPPPDHDRPRLDRRPIEMVVVVVQGEHPRGRAPPSAPRAAR